MDIQYRLQVKDDSGSSALVPIVGAAHSDSLQVTTQRGVAGWRPDLQFPVGRKGRLDWRTRQTDQGEMSFSILDSKVSEDGSDLQRWFSTFFGDLYGRMQPLGNIAVVQESVDGGAWTDWMTGRLNKITKVSDEEFEVRIKDMLGDYDVEVFGSRPHSTVSYVVEPLVLPLGVSADFGTVKAPRPLGGTTGSKNGVRFITISATSRSRDDNIVTQALVKRTRVAVGKVPLPLQVPIQPGLRVRVSGGSITDKELELIGIEVITPGAIPRAAVLWVRELQNTSDPFYTAFDTGAIANSTTVTFTIRSSDRTRETGKSAPLLIGDVDPIVFWNDLQDGKFCKLNDNGTVKRSFPKDATIFGVGAGTFRGKFPRVRMVIDKPWQFDDFLPKFCQFLQMGYRLGGSGEMIPLDLRPPQGTISVPTITNADVVSDYITGWESGHDDALTVMTAAIYLDDPISAKEVNVGGGNVPDIAATLLDSVQLNPFRFEDALGLDKYGEKSITIDPIGFRFMPGEVEQNTDRIDYYRSYLEQAALALFKPLSGGPQFTRIRGFRTASSLSTLQIGDLRILDLDELPDPGTNVRGGNRVAMCLERSEEGTEIEFLFMDLGPNTVAAQPTIGTPTKETGNTQNGLTVTVTLNGTSDPVEFQIAVVANGASRPADDDPNWRMVSVVGQTRPLIETTGSKTTRNLPGGKRVYVRARSRTYPKNPKIMSAWVYPAGTEYVDLDSVTAPNTLTYSALSTKGMLLSWSNNGDNTSWILIRLGKGTSQGAADADSGSDYIKLPPGSTTYPITGLDEYGAGVVWFHPKVVHIDGLGGESSAAELSPNISIQATGTPPVSPNLGGLSITRGYSSTGQPPAQSNGEVILVGYPGIELGIYVGPQGIGCALEIERSTTGGGVGFSNVDTIPVVNAQFYPWIDRLEFSTTTYYYRVRLTAPGASPGAYSREVSDRPGWILPLVNNQVPSEAVLGQIETSIITAGDFLSEASSGGTGWQFNGRRISPLTTAGAVSLFASLPSRLLPVGATVVQIRARVTAQSGDALILGFRYAVDNITTLVDTFTVVSTGDHTITFTGSSVGHAVASGRTYYMDLLMDANAAATNVGLYRVEIDFIRDSLRQ